jgi:hypothetical protein
MDLEVRARIQELKRSRLNLYPHPRRDRLCFEHCLRDLLLPLA